MKKKSLLAFFILVFAFVGLSITAIYAQDDSVLVSSVAPVPAETTVTVQVRLKTSVDLSAFEIPLKFRNDNNLEVQCDSIHWSEDWFWENEPSMYAGQGGDKSYMDNTQKTVMIWAQWFFDPFPAGDDTLCTVYFTTGTSWDPCEPVKIDTFVKLETPRALAQID